LRGDRGAHDERVAYARRHRPAAQCVAVDPDGVAAVGRPDAHVRRQSLPVPLVDAHLLRRAPPPFHLPAPAPTVSRPAAAGNGKSRRNGR